MASFDTDFVPVQRHGMIPGDLNTDDSQNGVRPGDPSTRPFALHMPEPSGLPVLIAAPHGGRDYPPGLRESCKDPDALMRLEDRMVDRLAEAVAAATGAGLLVANAPRAVIDLNRGAEDIDWSMVSDTRRETAGLRLSPRARGGLGLVPRRLPGTTDLWKEPLRREELESRLQLIHAPYHDALASALCALRDRWGCALLIDLHSMPPLPRGGAMPVADFVVGDRFGASCDGVLVATAFDYFARTRQRASHNRPYAGGYILDRHGRRDEGLHAMQLEVCRSLYLDTRLSEPSSRFDSVVALLAGLVASLGAETATLAGRHYTSLAAE